MSESTPHSEHVERLHIALSWVPKAHYPEARDALNGLEEQLEAVVEATRFKAGEDCWCAFRQVDDPDWHSPTCERVREILGASNPAKERLNLSDELGGF